MEAGYLYHRCHPWRPDDFHHSTHRLVRAGVAKNVVSIAALVNTVLSSVMAVITSQGGIVRDVLAMPGIENIAVNGRANQTLAAIAIDPLSDKIAPTASAQAQVTRTAQAA